MTAPTLTAPDICAALRRRYNKPSQGRAGEQWVCLDEARAGGGFDGNNGRCDFLAINTWRSRGHELIGHEIKITMADWHAELTQPEKAERFARHCHRWVVVAPAGLATRIVHEVPTGWGLLSVTDKGRVTPLRPAPAHEPEPVPAGWWIGWLAHIDRQHKRAAAAEAAELLATERAAFHQRVEAERAEKAQLRLDLDDTLSRNVAALRDATGIDLHHVPQRALESLGVAWHLAHDHGRLEVLVGQLRRAADTIEQAAAPPVAVS